MTTDEFETLCATMAARLTDRDKLGYIQNDRGRRAKLFRQRIADGKMTTESAARQLGVLDSIITDYQRAIAAQETDR